MIILLLIKLKLFKQLNFCHFLLKMVAYKKPQDAHNDSANNLETQNSRRARKAQTIYVIEVEQPRTDNILAQLNIQPVQIFPTKHLGQ